MLYPMHFRKACVLMVLQCLLSHVYAFGAKTPKLVPWKANTAFALPYKYFHRMADIPPVCLPQMNPRPINPPSCTSPGNEFFACGVYSASEGGCSRFCYRLVLSHVPEFGSCASRPPDWVLRGAYHASAVNCAMGDVEIRKKRSKTFLLEWYRSVYMHSFAGRYVQDNLVQVLKEVGGRDVDVQGDLQSLALYSKEIYVPPGGRRCTKAVLKAIISPYVRKRDANALLYARQDSAGFLLFRPFLRENVFRPPLCVNNPICPLPQAQIGF